MASEDRKPKIQELREARPNGSVDLTRIEEIVNRMGGEANQGLTKK